MSENVDYSFMKSGFDNTDTSHIDQAKNVTAIMVHFTENAMNTAAIYANHAKRREIVSEDIKRALMMEVFFFQKRNNLEEKINKIKQELYDADSDSDYDTDDEDDEDDEDNLTQENLSSNNEFIESTCECPLCKCVNSVYQRWENWTPETALHQILKEKLDNWDNLYSS